MFRFESALESFEGCAKDENLDEKVTSTINEMRLKAINALKNSELAKDFGHEFKTLAKNGDKSAEASADYKKMQWERTVALTSWEQVMIESDKCTSLCSWDIQSRVDDIELKLVNLWHLYSNKKPANLVKLV